jgi:hypothetical protein
MITSYPMIRLLRKAILLLAMALILSEIDAPAQQAPPKRVVPSGTLLQNIPAYAKWTVTYSYPSDRASQAANVPGAPPQTPPPPPSDSSTRTIITTKTGDIALEQTTTIKGDYSEKWAVGPTTYWKPSGSPDWYQGGTVSQSIFDGLNWIAGKTYVATIPYGSRTCFVFMPEGTATDEMSNPDVLVKKLPTIDQLTLIDSETRLPVEVRMGDIYHLYHFDSPPSGKLAVSPALLVSIKQYQESAERLGQRPPRPY